MIYAVRPDGTFASLRTPLTPALANVLALSPDGRQLVACREVGVAGINTAALSWGAGGLEVTLDRHVDLPAHCDDATFSANGDALYVTMSENRSVAVLQ